MSSDKAANNQRIAKNTLMLSIRMLITMGISLYTSRVVLQNLGVVDYGIYNVVGGVVAMLNFIINTMSGATARFITYDLGVGNIGKLKRTFGNILTIHILLSLFIVIFGETIGLWFVYNKLQIPADRFDAMLWVYQFSIFTAVLSIISTPYNSAIIAHEKMSAFAYISIMDAVLKLAISISIAYTTHDRLIVYAFLFFCMQLLDRIIYGVYCSRKFEETRVTPCFDKQTFKELFSFSGWLMIGSLASIAGNHGINIMLNMFFGPVVNAARALAYQVQGVVISFCKNFQMALNPQLTKSYAAQDLQAMRRLIVLSSKYSTFLMLAIGLPVIFKVDFFLAWWLVEIPENTASFIRIGVIMGILSAINNPIINGIQATGEIKKFQIVEGLCLLTIIPVSYICLRFFHFSSVAVISLGIVIEFLTQCVRLKIVLPKLNIKIKMYLSDVVVPIIKVSLASLIVPCLLDYFFEGSFFAFSIVCATAFLSVVVSVFLFGCTQNEKDSLFKMVKQKIH